MGWSTCTVVWLVLFRLCCHSYGLVPDCETLSFVAMASNGCVLNIREVRAGEGGWNSHFTTYHIQMRECLVNVGTYACMHITYCTKRSNKHRDPLVLAVIIIHTYIRTCLCMFCLDLRRQRSTKAVQASEQPPLHELSASSVT